MAKKRKAPTAKRRTTRRRISGMGNAQSMLTNTAGVIVGAAAGNFLSNFIAQKSGNAKLVAGATIAAGIFAPKLIKSAMGANIGAGIVAVGGIQMLKAFGVPGINGLDEGLAGYGSSIESLDTDDTMSGYLDGSVAGYGDGSEEGYGE